MKIIELFSGTGSFSKVAKERGHETFKIDSDIQHNPDLCKDILDFEISYLPVEWRNPDIVWASPPCTTFSVASISHYWKDGKPSSWRTHIGIAIAMKTLELIRRFCPEFFFIENPRGMLRKQDFMKNLHRKTVTYCQYGAKVQKPTDIWTNLSEWIPKRMCHSGDKCHESAKRGADRGTQSQNRSPIKRAIIPPALCEEIIEVCEGNGKVIQKALE